MFTSIETMRASPHMMTSEVRCSRGKCGPVSEIRVSWNKKVLKKASPQEMAAPFEVRRRGHVWPCVYIKWLQKIRDLLRLHKCTPKL